MARSRMGNEFKRGRRICDLSGWQVCFRVVCYWIVIGAEMTLTDAVGNAERFG